MTSFEIVAGSYEEFLLGYVFNSFDCSLKPSFASHDHSASIRCVAVCGKYMASGAADDRIIIYDLKTRKEHCMLTQHNATVNCVQFTDNNSHIISGSADGVISIVRVGNWQLEKVWDKAHRGQAILDVALHPSGKLALTLGADCSLITWNLVKGRRAFIVNLNSHSKKARSLEKILWAKDGVRFIIYGGNYTEIWSVNTGGILKVIEYKERVCSCIWFSPNQILVGFENGELCLTNIEEESSKQTYAGHSGRIKSLLKHREYIISASSTGEIKVWNDDMEEVASVNSGCRLTCLSLIPVVDVKKEEIEDDPGDKSSEIPKNKPVKKSTVVIEIDDAVNDREDKRFDAMKHSKKNGINNKKKGKLEDVTDSKSETRINVNKTMKNRQQKEEIRNYDNNMNHNADVVTNKKKKKKKKKPVDTTDGVDLMEYETPNDHDESKTKSPEPVNKKKKRKTASVDDTEVNETTDHVKKKKSRSTL